jgi:hypothetical protein
LSAYFAMPVVVPSAFPAGQDDEGAVLAARVAAGPGLWEDEGWLGELRRGGLVTSLLADGVIGKAAAGGVHGHRLERALGAAMTLLCVITACLFAGQGYDMILARAFRMPGTRVRPGTPVPTGPALSQARARLGEDPVRRAFELDAARDDVPLAAGGTAFGLELVIFDGTTLDLFACPELAAEFGVPEGGTHPKLRAVALLQAGTMRWKAAALGGYHDGENALCDQLEGALGPGQLSLADRGFFSMDRWLRFSSAGAHLLWRVKNTARAVPFRHVRTLKDGSELVLLRESGNMLGKRRRDAGDCTLARLPDTVARLVCFTILTRTRRGRTKTAQVRVLTTLAGPRRLPRPGNRGALRREMAGGNRISPFETNRPRHRAAPARTLARPGQARSVGTVPGPQHDRRPGGPGRGHGRDRHRRRVLHCRAVPRPRPSRRRRLLPALRPPAQHRRRPARPPYHRDRRTAPGQGKQETNPGRTTSERSRWPTEEADYNLTIVPSNLPKADTSPRSLGQWA